MDRGLFPAVVALFRLGQVTGRRARDGFARCASRNLVEENVLGGAAIGLSRAAGPARQPTHSFFGGSVDWKTRPSERLTRRSRRQSCRSTGVGSHSGCSRGSRLAFLERRSIFSGAIGHFSSSHHASAADLRLCRRSRRAGTLDGSGFRAAGEFGESSTRHVSSERRPPPPHGSLIHENSSLAAETRGHTPETSA